MSGIKDKLHIIKKNLKNPGGLVFKICNYDHYQFAPLFSDKLYIKCYYERFMKKKLTSKQLKCPRTFNEKLNWRKLYDRQPIYTTMADKVDGKKYIENIVGGQYIIPTIGIYDSVDEVPFDKLPEQYVIKCSHDSGSIYICRDKATFDVEKVKADFRVKLKRNFYWASREWQYKNIKPRVIVEKYIHDSSDNYPMDYKFYCFDGKVHYLEVDFNRFTEHKANYYNRDFEPVKFNEVSLFPDKDVLIEKPNQYEKMLEIAEKLSKGISHLRVDLYYINSHIYVGELTICSGGGVSPYLNNGDEILGDCWILPKKSRR